MASSNIPYRELYGGHGGGAEFLMRAVVYRQTVKVHARCVVKNGNSLAGCAYYGVILSNLGIIE